MWHPNFLNPLFNSEKYFLYVGRLTINKGIENLLEIFKKIESIYPEYKLIFIGDGPLKNEIEKLENRIKKSKVNLIIINI